MWLINIHLIRLLHRRLPYRLRMPFPSSVPPDIVLLYLVPELYKTIFLQSHPFRKAAEPYPISAKSNISDISYIKASNIPSSSAASRSSSSFLSSFILFWAMVLSFCHLIIPIHLLQRRLVPNWLVAMYETVSVSYLYQNLVHLI